MGKEFLFIKRADLVDVAAGKQIVAQSVGPRGEAVLLAVMPEDEEAPFERDRSAGGVTFPKSRAQQGYAGTFIELQDEIVSQHTALRNLEVSFPFIQPLPSKEILVVGSRCDYRHGDPEQNAFVFNEQGQELRRFVLGDGISDIQVDKEGFIWVSYFDEGVFGNYGWNQPIGSPGIVCFDRQGAIQWRFEPPPGFDPIFDCYAMNVAHDFVWACYYTDFPLVRIDPQKKTRAWKNDVAGVTAIAADKRRVLLFGGYGDNYSRCVIQEFDDNELLRSREIKLCLPDDRSFKNVRIIGRGSTLHAFSSQAWFSFDLEELQ